MPTFAPLKNGSIRVQLDESEAAVLRRLVEELRDLLLVNEKRPEHVIRGRLFPNAYDNVEQEKSYRELVDSDLLEGKLAALDLLEQAIGASGSVDTEIPPAEVDPWLTAVTDMRLAIGTRLQVDEEKMSAELDPKDPDAPALGILHWLGWIQELLLEAIGQGDVDAEPGGR